MLTGHRPDAGAAARRVGVSMNRQHGHRVALAALVAIVLSVPPPVARTADAAGSAPCRVRNVTQDTRDTSFRRMVAAAHNGDRLRVRGTCSGGVRILKDLVIVGVGPHATLSGRDRFRVLTIDTWGSGATHVRLRDIRIVRGRRGGIAVTNADLSLVDSIVAGNTGGRIAGLKAGGSGIAVEDGSAILTRSVVRGNTSTGSGGGILVVNGALTLIHSTVRGNRARQGGGISNIAASVTLIDSTVRANTSVRAGGGIHNVGQLRLRRSSVQANTAGTDGGGIYSETEYDEWARGGSYGVELVASTVTHNTAGRRGGGILAKGGSVAEYPFEGVVSLADTTVRVNHAGLDGGGIYAFPDKLTVVVSGSTTVTDNDPNDCVGTSAC